jgi:hypothetical protein
MEIVVFFTTSVHLCHTKNTVMKERTYQRFEALLQTGSFDSYEDICLRLGVSPDDMDEVLMNELGCPGMQVYDEYFGNRYKNY